MNHRFKILSGAVALMIGMVGTFAEAAKEKIVDRSKVNAKDWAAKVAEEAEGKPVLIGGQVADPTKWPASVYARMGSSRCSATVVGERTLLIASHCVSNGGTASFSVGANAYSSVCSHTSGYPANSTYDWAICLINRKVEGIPYERFGMSGAGLKVGAQLRLTGYGCTKSNGTGGNDGIFRIGLAPIVRLPSGTTNADIVTQGSVALCYGDSGGAVYLEDASGGREIVGNNSRGNISTTSYLPWVGHSQFKAKLASWSTTNGQKVCGFHEDAQGCRGAPKPDDPKPDPMNCKMQLSAFEDAKTAADGKFSALKECVTK